MSGPDSQSTSVGLAAAARDAAGNRRIALAEELYTRVLSILPDNAEALAFLGASALRRGENAKALALLSRAELLDSADDGVKESLGIARLRAGDVENAVRALDEALRLAPRRHIARLFLGRARELVGQPHNAALEYVRAVEMAQARGLWASQTSTAPWLVAEVKQAIASAKAYRKGIVAAALEPVRARHGQSALRRVDKCVAMHVRDIAKAMPDERQKPKALYFPDIPATPYLQSELFPWVATLEAKAAAIRAEAQAQLQAPATAFESFLHFEENWQVDRHLRNSRGSPPSWDAFFFYRHGARYDENSTRCPATAEALESLPLARVRDHSPEICFSLLTPGTHILPHYGDTNTRVVAHLPLIVPEACALNVGGEVRAWREGEVIVFDDTFLHEAWNHSSEARVVLILDAWNPYLTEAERDAVTAIVETLGIFDRECRNVPSSDRA
jgi:aspartate beta-hydroxylase